MEKKGKGMSDGGLHSFWNSLQRAEQRMEAEATEVECGLYRTVYGYKSRVMRMRSALAKSGPLALQTQASEGRVMRSCFLAGDTTRA